MSDMTFTAIIALGMNAYCGAVLSVTAADNDVCAVVSSDIRSEGDKDFIDALGKEIPNKGLLKVVAMLDFWPSDDAPSYTVISVTPLEIPS